MGSFYAVFLHRKKKKWGKKANFSSFWELSPPHWGATQNIALKRILVVEDKKFSSFMVFYHGKSAWTFPLKLFKQFFPPTCAGVNNVLMNQAHNLLFQINTLNKYMYKHWIYTFVASWTNLLKLFSHFIGYQLFCTQ